MGEIKKIKFISSEIYQKLSSLSDVIDTKPLIGILNDFLFEFDKDKVTITASNLQTTFTTTASITTTEKFSIAIPAKILLDTLKNLSSQEIEMTINTEKNIISLKTYSGVYRISYEAASAFPKIAISGEKKTITIPAKTLYSIIKKPLIAASNDSAKQIINSVLLHFENDKIISVATDIHRLIKSENKCQTTCQLNDIVIPKKNLQGLLSLLSSNEKDATLEIDKKYCSVNTTDFTWVSTLIDERYPDYERVIPQNNPNTMTIHRDELIAALKRIIIFTSDVSYQAVFEIVGQQVKITASDTNFGNDAEEFINIFYSGQDHLKISFNVKYLIELLQDIDSDEITISFSPINENFITNKAAIIKPEDSQKDNITMLIMPMIL